MIITVTDTAQKLIPVTQGRRYSTGIFQNENTDVDVYIGFGSAPTVSGAADAGVLVSRAAGTNVPTTLILGGDVHTSQLSGDIWFIHGGSGSKSFRVNLM